MKVKKSTEEIVVERIRREKDILKREKLRRDRLFHQIKIKKKYIESGGDVWQRIKNLSDEQKQKELFKAALDSGNMLGSILGVPPRRAFEPTKFEPFDLS
jgi:hypothetical protein